MPPLEHIPDEAERARFNGGHYTPPLLFEPRVPSGKIWPHLVFPALLALCVLAARFL